MLLLLLEHLLKLLDLMKVQLHASHNLLLRAVVLWGINMQTVDDLNSLCRLLACDAFDSTIISGRSVETVQHVITHPVVHNALLATAAMCAIDVALVKAWVGPLGGLRCLDRRSGRIVHVRATKGWLCAYSIVLGSILSRCALVVRERLCLLMLCLNLRMHWQWILHIAVMERRSRKSHMMVPQPHPLDCRQDLHVFLNRVPRRTKGSLKK